MEYKFKDIFTKYNFIIYRFHHASKRQILNLQIWNYSNNSRNTIYLKYLNSNQYCTIINIWLFNTWLIEAGWEWEKKLQSSSPDSCSSYMKKESSLTIVSIALLGARIFPLIDEYNMASDGIK